MQTPAEKRAIYEARKAAGVCVKCAQPKERSTVICDPCADQKERSRQRRSLLRQRAKIEQRLQQLDQVTV